MATAASILHYGLALVLSPLLLSLIERTKAMVAGRQGPPLLQSYYDLAKLLRKGAVYSRTTSWLFRAGPVVGLASVLVAMLFVPLGGLGGLAAFPGDLIVLVYVLGLMRFLTVLAAMDTGSAFEGLGASREMQFSLLAEPALLLGLAVLSVCVHSLGLSEIYAGLYSGTSARVGPAAVLVGVTFLIVLLAENARIPVDDPNTHLELTMIHEVMVLDHGGVDLGFILYSSALKLWIFSALLVGVVVPVRTGVAMLDLLIGLVGILAVAVSIGVIESTMARLRLVKVPQMLVLACVLAVVAVLWISR